METIRLDGDGLAPAAVARIADGARVLCDGDALARMDESRAVLERAIAEGRAIYGVTTGLGPKVVERLPDDALAAMSLDTIRGRAHAVGALLPARLVRGGMAVRLNTLLRGASGVRPGLAEHIAACLNAGVVPAVRETGSVGAADLPWGAAIGLALAGEGAVLAGGGTEPAAAALARAGIAPWRPAPREGLALVAHPCLATAIAALGANEAETAFAAAQTAAALSLEAFRANLSPIRADVLALRPQPGQAAAAAGLAARLAGSALWRAGEARRLQDPLSIRHAVHVQGAVRAALDWLGAALEPELNGTPDSPAALVATDEVLGQGGYLTPHLAVALGALADAQRHHAAQIVARCAKLMSERLSGLPRGLGDAGAGSAGMGPVLKTAEALAAEIGHLAVPAPVHPGFSTDGVEDVQTHVAIPSKAALGIAARLRRLVAVELVVAAQAAERRGLGDRLAPPLRPALAALRETSPALAADRPLGEEIEALAAQVGAGVFGAP
jgi:histidine ammonia-lyase